MARLLLGALVFWLVLSAAGAADDQSTLRAREAGAALARGSFDQAITLYTEALDDKTLPNDRRAIILTDRGVAHARRQSPKEAIEDFNRAIQLYPEYAAVYNNRGNVLLGVGAVREAIKDFDRALVLAPGYAAAFSNRAGAHMRLGQIDPAIADYTKAICSCPANPAALTGRGSAHLEAYPPAGAIRDFVAGRDRRCAFQRRLPQSRGGQDELEKYDEAIEDFSRADRLRAAERRALSAAGRGLPGGRQRACRRQGFHDRDRIEPRNAWAYAVRGFAYAEGRGRTRRRSTISGAPSSWTRARRRLSPIAPGPTASSSSPSSGCKDVERALKLDPNSAEAYWARGEIHEAQGRAAAASADLQARR